MTILDPSRILNNLLALGIISGVGFMIYSKMDKEQVKSLIEGIKRVFGKKEG